MANRVPPIIRGEVAPGFELVRSAFERNFIRGIAIIPAGERAVISRKEQHEYYDASSARNVAAG